VTGGEPVRPLRHRAGDRLARQRPGGGKVIAMKRTTVGDVMTTRVVAVKKGASFAVRGRLSYAGRSDDS
jgi:hypothetical protein